MKVSCSEPCRSKQRMSGGECTVAAFMRAVRAMSLADSGTGPWMQTHRTGQSLDLKRTWQLWAWPALKCQPVQGWNTSPISRAAGAMAGFQHEGPQDKTAHNTRHPMRDLSLMKAPYQKKKLQPSSSRGKFCRKAASSSRSNNTVF